jgi:hypothetical protein
MTYAQITKKLIRRKGVEHSTMMKSPYLRYQGEFIAMMFDKENALIIKVLPQRVNEIIAASNGKEFKFTKKRFKEWVLIPIELESSFEAYILEALAYAKEKN